MAIFKTGLNRQRDLHHEDITTTEWGSDGTAPNASQTDLITPIAGTELTPVKSVADQTVIVKSSINGLTAVGDTFREIVSRDADDGATDRSVFPAWNHTANDELILTKQYFHRQG